MCPTTQRAKTKKCATVKGTHAINKKMQAVIVTMNTALANIFLEALSLQVHASFLQWRLCKLNIVFVDMFVRIVDHYGKMTAEDCKAANAWQPTGIPLASSPAWRLRAAPTSRWLTAT
jgi:hypothetical protein